MMTKERYSQVSKADRGVWTIVLGAWSLVVAGCGGDGSVGIGGGQDPDPVVLDFAVAYVKRPLALDEDGNLIPIDVRELVTHNGASDLYFRDRASPSTEETNITFRAFGGLADVKDVEFSYDGERVIFAMRAPLDENLADDDPAQPTWNIWEYDIPTDDLRRIIVSDITAEAGHDVAPHYLPDGRIVYTSTRQRQSRAILLDEGKPQFAALDEDENEPAFVLHVMDADGGNMKQLSFNQSHDLQPAVLDSGRIVFSRWDHAPGNNGIHLYTVNPDGSGLQLLYGANSHDTGTNAGTVQFLHPRQADDGRILAIIAPFTGTDGGGQIVAIDTPNYVENTQPTMPNIGILTGPAQEAATVNDVRTDGQPSLGGVFRTLYPLRDGTDRMLVSWSPCRLLIDPTGTGLEPTRIVPCTPANLADPSAVPAPPLYGVWIYDSTEGTQLPVAAPEEGFIITDIVAAQPRALPAIIPDGVVGLDLDPDLVAEGVGVLHIRSVYDVDGVDTATPDIATLADPAQTMADDRPARFVRLVKIVSKFDEDLLDLDIPNTAFGPNQALGMREIIGYATIEPDGSLKVKAPANVALSVQLLDENGRRISPRHNNWLQTRPGAVTECDGCHAPASGLSHGHPEAFSSVNPGALTTGQPFPNTDPALFADFGETMAETRFRIGCATDCSAFAPNADVDYEDFWTDEVAAGRAKDAPFSFRYSDLNTPAPTGAGCLPNWTSGCRIVINYEMHIDPLWSTPRLVLDTDGVTVIADNTCTTCHNPVDAAGMAQVPASQLDLTNGPSDQEPEPFTSYRELLFTDNEQELVNDVLQDRLVQIGIDPVTGDPILAPVAVAPSMSAGSANASATFFSRFDAGGTHDGRLSEAEKRLVSEWLDIGAQYYNNPFDVPQN